LTSFICGVNVAILLMEVVQEVEDVFVDVTEPDVDVVLHAALPRDPADRSCSSKTFFVDLSLEFDVRRDGMLISCSLSVLSTCSSDVVAAAAADDRRLFALLARLLGGDAAPE